MVLYLFVAMLALGQFCDVCAIGKARLPLTHRGVATGLLLNGYFIFWLLEHYR